MVLGRCAFSRFWANDDQSWTTRLRSSQSLCLSLRSTALFFLQYCTWYHIYIHLPRSESETKLPLYGEQVQKILAALWSEECVSLIDEIGFERLITDIGHESLYAKLPNKNVDRCAFPRLRAYDV